MAGETGPSLARRAAWTVVNAAADSSKAWATARQRLTVLLGRPGEHRDQDLQRRLDWTQQRVTESRLAGSRSVAAADIRYLHVLQWTELFQGALDGRPELADGLAELIDELSNRFGLASDQPEPEDRAASPPASVPSSAEPGGFAAPPGSPAETGLLGGRRGGSLPGASFGDHDDLDEQGEGG
ncbi:MAG TPA: hypothetical protein VHY31_00780 [Streptosporangiaceae bacterium]|nr:hypothetical protein [Streptosporangiaceae bacterium]